jgi:hypothetical protein
MNKKLYLLMCASTLSTQLYSDTSFVNVLQGKSFFNARSQSEDAASELTGWHPFIHRDTSKNYATFAFNMSYARSIRANRISEALFGTDRLVVSGSMVTNRGPNDILADYFGLSPEFISDVHLAPRIQNAMVTFQGFWGFNTWCKGLYLQVKVPAVWTEWDMNMTECVNDSGSSVPFPPLYMDIDSVQAPVTSFVQALKGDTTFGAMQSPLQYGKVDGAQSKGGISEIQLALGYDFILREHGHAGLNIRTAIPTGTRPNSEYLFEPVVGNGKHWELGVGFSGDVLIWAKDGDQELRFFADVNLTHLFSSRQKRSFDIHDDNCGCDDDINFGSRYILIKEFDNDGNATGELAPLINKSSLPCHVHISIELDMVFMFGYTYRNFLFDIGYNGWIRSREKISLDRNFPNNRYGLKGIQDAFFGGGAPSNITQSNATLMGNNFADQLLVADINSPVLLKEYNIDLHSAAASRAMTHKLFTYFGYAWEERFDENKYVPFVGVGADIEFEGINIRDTFQPNKTTLSQWSFWLKAGFAT